MTLFASDLEFPEGPVLLPDGSFLFVEMSPETGCVTWISADGQSRRRVARTGRPNGLAPDAEGNIWVAETAQKALLKLSLDGRYEVFASSGEEQPFRFLNDLAFAPNGDLYLTDSGVELEEFAPGGELNPDYEKLDYDGRVYRIDVRSGQVETMDRNIRFTNGIAFGPDQNLYVAETLTGTIFRYGWEAGRLTGSREAFANVIDPDAPQGIRGPDGMKFGADGNLYVAVFGQGDVTVVSPAGEVIERYPVGGIYPTNLVFGKSGERSIYVTEAETGTVRRLAVGTDGFPLYT
jgi:gluconolactonase